MEFKANSLVIPIEDIEHEHFYNICKLFKIKIDPGFLINKWDTYYDDSRAKYYGDTTARIGNGNILYFPSPEFENTFIIVDMFNHATDQSDTIMLYIQCNNSMFEEATVLMEKLNEESSILTELSIPTENLGEIIEKRNYPKKREDFGYEYMQDIEVFE